MKKETKKEELIGNLGNNMARSSNSRHFHEMDINERLDYLKEYCLDDNDLKLLAEGISLENAARLSENVIAIHGMPLGIATNFKVNGKNYLVPMAIEESSVVAAASNGAKYALPEGFTAEWLGNVTVGMIQLKVQEPQAVKRKLMRMKSDIIEWINDTASSIVKRGGGARDVTFSIVKTARGPFVVVYLYVDTVDAMGANTINSVCERLAPRLKETVGGDYILRILSNYAPEKVARARATFSKDLLGEDCIERMLDGYALACADIRRATTHNKGIMNGIDAVAIATGNDWRALEAGAHAYAARNGRYAPLTHYEKDTKGNLIGTIEIPIQIGIVGGITSVHPTTKIALKILGVTKAQELACVMASVGLAQNFAALRALAVEGIQRGHMELHAVNLAMAAGAEGKKADEIAKRMVAEGRISLEYAKRLLEEYR
jgi:hydroxymethylglutaryl-CoA reductase